MTEPNQIAMAGRQQCLGVANQGRGRRSAASESLASENLPLSHVLVMGLIFAFPHVVVYAVYGSDLLLVSSVSGLVTANVIDFIEKRLPKRKATQET